MPGNCSVNALALRFTVVMEALSAGALVAYGVAMLPKWIAILFDPPLAINPWNMAILPTTEEEGLWLLAGVYAGLWAFHVLAASRKN